MKPLKIIGFAVIGLLISINAFSQNKTEKKETMPTQKENSNEYIATQTFTVNGNCAMCKKTIEKAAKSIEGVQSADWNVETHLLTLKYDESTLSKNGQSVDNILMKIAEAGYDTPFYKAEEDAYKALPQCCQYDRSQK